MPSYRVEALEKWTVATVYVVEADNAQEAEAKCRSGDEPCEKDDVQDVEWIETIAVEEEDGEEEDGE